VDPTTPQPSEDGPAATMEVGGQAEVVPAEQVAAEQAEQEKEGQE
jgi:hypothetical protein